MNKYKIQLSKTNNDNNDQLTLSGELSINHIDLIKDEIESLINIDSPYKIIVKDADIIDLSLIQLLLSLKNLNPKSEIHLVLNDEMMGLINISGFKNLFNMKTN